MEPVDAPDRADRILAALERVEDKLDALEDFLVEMSAADEVGPLDAPIMWSTPRDA